MPPSIQLILEIAARRHVPKTAGMSSRETIKEIMPALVRMRADGMTWALIKEVLDEAGLAKPNGSPFALPMIIEGLLAQGYHFELLTPDVKPISFTTP